MGEYKRNTAGRILEKSPRLIMPTDLIHRIGIVLGRRVYRAISTEECIRAWWTEAGGL